MSSILANVFLDLSAKCDRRTKALLKVIDALEEIKNALPKTQKTWSQQDWKIFYAYKKALEEIESNIKGEESNGKF